MHIQTLNETLMPFNEKEIHYFNEATQGCTDEQKLAVAKEMLANKPPKDFHLTKEAIAKFVLREKPLNWYPGVTSSSSTVEEADAPRKLYRSLIKSGMSKERASAISAYTPPLSHYQEETEGQVLGSVAENVDEQEEAEAPKKLYESLVANGMNKERASTLSDYTPESQ
jgi:hypothetical protein